MDARGQRGLAIAATCKITCKGGQWLVPSASQDGKKYTVVADPDAPTCSCPDFEERGMAYMHIPAVRYVLQRRNNRDGSMTVAGTLPVSQTVERKTTCPQSWSACNVAQAAEKSWFFTPTPSGCG